MINITEFQEASNIIEVLGVFNANSFNLWVTGLLLTAYVIMLLFLTRQNRDLIKSMVLSGVVMLIPSFLLATQTYNSIPLVPAWFVIFLLVTIGVCAVFVRNSQKN